MNLDANGKLPKLPPELVEKWKAHTKKMQEATEGKMRRWIHRRLNCLVTTFGDWPIIGRLVWWIFGQWQRLM